MVSAAAARYARALIEVVTAPRSPVEPAAALKQLRAIEAVITSSEDLRNALLSPAVSPSKKRAVMARLIEPVGAVKLVRNFLFVVIDHRRVHEFSSIVEAFELLLDEHLGVIRTDVASVHALSEAEKIDLEAQLSRLSGKKAKLRFTIDETLIGGVLARLGSTVYDGSVRGQLEKLKRVMENGNR